MAKITKEELLKLAKLSRLHLKDDELDGLTKDVDSILEYVEQLQSVDLREFEPTSQVTGLVNVMRPDEPVNYGVSQEELLKNVPEKERNYIKVRRVLE
jgi:aspartyl-tRNA(Asn)/glutamyl-tRNA(Gln) amidotransferase subunit C